MRLGNIAGRASIVVDDGAIDLETATAGAFSADPQEAIERIDEIVALGSAIDGPVVAIDETLVGPPSPRPGQMMAIGMNYRSHALEMGLETSPIPAVFAKFRSSLGRPFGKIDLPSETIDYEAELVLVIKKRTSHVTPETAWDHVAGVTAGQDLSDRYIQMAAGRQFSLGKSYPGFASFGPWLATLDEFADVNNISIGCSVDGEQLQDGHSSDMVFPVPELLTSLSAVLTLEAGDVIFTGSPAGAGQSHKPPRFLKPGEELVTWVESVGTMRHTLVAGEQRPT